MKDIGRVDTYCASPAIPYQGQAWPKGLRLPPLTLGMKLGLALLACLLIMAGNLLVATRLYDSLAGASRIVNESGRLRYLSQKVAYLATRLEPGDRAELGRQVIDYSATLAALRGALEANGHAPAIATPELRSEIAAIENQWRAYRHAVETIRTSALEDAQARTALAFLHAVADQILDRADRIVSLLVEAEGLVRQRVHLQLFAIFVAEGLLLLGIFLFVQQKVSKPLRRLSGLCRQLARGDYSKRMPVHSRDEVGELAIAFNEATAITARLIHDLNKRTRESALLHRLATLMQTDGHVSARVFQQAAKLLPDGWLHREVAAARIVYGASAYQTPDFRSTPWCQKAEFHCSAGLPVTVEVCYLEARPTADEGPFLHEERALLDAVAEMLQFYIEDVNARRSQARLYSILEETADMVGTFAADGTLLYLNHAAKAVTGVETDQGRSNIADLFPEWVRTIHARAALPVAARIGFWNGEAAILGREGREIPVSQTITAHKALDGTVSYYSTIFRDIGDRIRMEERLTQSRDFYLSLFHDFPDPIWRIDLDGRADYFNHAWLAFTGRPLDQQTGTGWIAALHPDDRADTDAALRAALVSGERLEIEFRLRRHDGEYRWFLSHGSPYRDLDGDRAGFVGSCYDITERKRIESELEQIANYDSLTNLPNRNLLADRLSQALAFARRQQCQAAVMFLDLDRFKHINDTLGHEIGDRLLAVVAERLRKDLREGDTVARLGGDEFVVVLPDVASEKDIDTVARKLLESLAAPIQIDTHELFVSASLGISLYPRDGSDIQALLKNADAAMYRAKEEGRNNYQFYAQEMNARAIERFELDASLRRALERDEFELHYQPQVDLASGRIAGMEALIRWRHPEWGLVSPARFIPLAEETGMIVPIGEWALRTACAQARAWQDGGLPPLRIAVNLSARQLRQAGIVEKIEAVLAESGLDGRHLKLELTESMLMHDPEHVIRVLQRLRQSGVRFSLDDFGTGYSSLGYLKRFPIDEIKIDQGFVREMTHNPEDAAIVRAIIAIAQSLKLKVVAEGVETEGQLNYLRRNHCNEMQGYLFSRPLPAAEFFHLLQEGRKLRLEENGAHDKNLLIVDDEPGVISALQRTLRQDGYRIITATSPHAGLELLAKHDIHVVISDQRMTDMNGSEFLGRVRDLSPATVRIVLSGYTELGSITDAINRGCIYKFLTKPWDNDQLREEIRNAFRHHDEARASSRS